jgi:NAD(P)H dehydrogenase (quinone)
MPVGKGRHSPTAADDQGRTIAALPPITEYCTSIEATGVPPYIVQHLRGAMADYQNGRMSGADNNMEKLTGRRSMTVGEFARAHVDVLNGNKVSQ